MVAERDYGLRTRVRRPARTPNTRHERIVSRGLLSEKNPAWFPSAGQRSTDLLGTELSRAAMFAPASSRDTWMTQLSPCSVLRLMPP